MYEDLLYLNNELKLENIDYDTLDLIIKYCEIHKNDTEFNENNLYTI